MKRSKRMRYLLEKVAPLGTVDLETAVKTLKGLETGFTLAELCGRVAEAEGVAASPSMMCRELRRLRLPRKKGRSTTASGIRRGSEGCAASSPGGCDGR